MICVLLHLDFVPVDCIPAFGFKLFFLIYAEYSHKMSHVPLRLRPTWVMFLQRWKPFGICPQLMLPPHVHNLHHQDPFSHRMENNFCQIGIANAFLNNCLRITRNRWLYLGVVAFLTVFDAVVCGLLCSFVFEVNNSTT